MLTLCGFSASNYYNKVKLALLEKGVAFEEEHVYPSANEELLDASPMGKVPFIKTSAGTLSESQAIVEYLEEVFPDSPLYPADPYARAKCREFIHLVELYLELPARRLYPAAHFGGVASDETKRDVAAALARGARALARLSRFEAFASGSAFTYADCAALMHFPLVTATTKLIYAEDLLAAVPGLKPYLERMREREHVARVNRDRQAGMEAFIAYRAARAATAATAERAK